MGTSVQGHPSFAKRLVFLLITSPSDAISVQLTSNHNLTCFYQSLVWFQYRVKIPQTPTLQDHAEEENLGQDAVPESGETQESSCKAENNSRTGKSDEKMGITELKNYHPVTGISNFFFLSSFTFPFIINDHFQMLGSHKI